MARRPKWIKNQKPLEVGQLVWLLEDMTPRGIWAVGLEQKLVNSSDGKVRLCFLNSYHIHNIQQIIKLFCFDYKD